MNKEVNEICGQIEKSDLLLFLDLVTRLRNAKIELSERTVSSAVSKVLTQKESSVQNEGSRNAP